MAATDRAFGNIDRIGAEVLLLGRRTDVIDKLISEVPSTITRASESFGSSIGSWP
jgi:hypothetical protein